MMWFWRSMPRKKTPTSLPLFVKPTRERALELVARHGIDYPIGWRRKFCAGVCCKGKKSMGHGPYAYTSRGGHLGGQEQARELEAARVMFAPELERARAAVAAILGPQKTSSRAATRGPRGGAGANTPTTRERKAVSA